MYSQIAIIFVILGIFAVLHIVTIILVINMLKSKPHRHSGDTPRAEFSNAEGVGVAFCKKCKTGFDAKYNICPKCGTPR